MSDTTPNNLTKAIEFALQCIDGRIGLTKGGISSWESSFRAEAPKRVSDDRHLLAKQEDMRLEIAALLVMAKPFQVWPVRVNADCEGKTSKVVATFCDKAKAEAFCKSDECHRADEYGQDGWLGQSFEVRP